MNPYVRLLVGWLVCRSVSKGGNLSFQAPMVNHCLKTLKAEMKRLLAGDAWLTEGKMRVEAKCGRWRQHSRNESQESHFP